MQTRDEKLEQAVYKKDLRAIKSLLRAGANPNLRPKHKNKLLRLYQCGNKLLHDVDCIKIAKELLSYGALVNSRNMRNETPLHTAIKYGRPVNFVKQLLNYGADVNAKKNKDKTPLYLAVKKKYCSVDLEVVKVLLEHGADVNVKDHKGISPLNLAVKGWSADLEVVKELLKRGADINAEDHKGNTPLNLAVRCWDDKVEVMLENLRGVPDDEIGDNEDFELLYRAYKKAGILIKITLLTNFSNDCKKMINLDTDKHAYSELADFINKCELEIGQMKADRINNISVYEFVTTKDLSRKVFYPDGKKGISEVSSMLTKYPIYYDVLMSKIKFASERANLLKKLQNIQIYTKPNSFNQNVKTENIILDFNSTQYIAEYLSNEDLFNFVIAFGKCTKQSRSSLKSFIERVNAKISQNHASTSKIAKRPRLE